MSRIFLDTNFLMDFLSREEYKQDCEELLSLGSRMGCTFHISYLSIANFSYILRKLPPEVVKENISKLCRYFEIIPNTREQIEKTLTISPRDFEDGLQYTAAVDGGCDLIITRNQKDFYFSEIPVLSPKEYISRYGIAK